MIEWGDLMLIVGFRVWREPGRRAFCAVVERPLSPDTLIALGLCWEEALQ